MNKSVYGFRCNNFNGNRFLLRSFSDPANAKIKVLKMSFKLYQTTLLIQVLNNRKLTCIMQLRLLIGKKQKKYIWTKSKQIYIRS